MATQPAHPVPPLGLYVHLPWCARKCPYCDFNSHAADHVPERDYVAALLVDLDDEAPRVAGRAVESVFIGGGTPSLFSEAAIGALLEGIDRRVTLAPGCEVTLEANPGSAEAARFAGYRAAGVNRLSIGVQSFDDALLEGIGRVHDARAARRAIEMAGAAGFASVNVDLMYGLPGQSVAAAVADLDRALDYGVAHLSHYELTIEPNTLFHRFPPERPDDDARWAMHEAGLARIADAGLARYEVSAYARPGRRCRHNLNYWRFGDYLGIGAGAHGKRSDGAPGAVERSVKHRHPRRYLEARGPDGHTARRHPVPAAELPLEFMLNAARLVDGFEETLLEARTGISLSAVEAPLEAARARGLVVRRGGRIRPTERGMRFLNELLLLFETPSGEGHAAGAAKRAPVHREGGAPVL